MEIIWRASLLAGQSDARHLEAKLVSTQYHSCESCLEALSQLRHEYMKRSYTPAKTHTKYRFSLFLFAVLSSGVSQACKAGPMQAIQAPQPCVMMN